MITSFTPGSAGGGDPGGGLLTRAALGVEGYRLLPTQFLGEGKTSSPPLSPGKLLPPPPPGKKNIKELNFGVRIPKSQRGASPRGPQAWRGTRTRCHPHPVSPARVPVSPARLPVSPARLRRRSPRRLSRVMREMQEMQEMLAVPPHLIEPCVILNGSNFTIYLVWPVTADSGI